MAGRRVLLIVWRACPSPPLLDSGLRRNDEVGWRASPWPCEGRIRRMKIAGCRGYLAGKKLRRYGVPYPWTPAPYRGTGHAFDRRSDELGVDPGQ